MDRVQLLREAALDILEIPAGERSAKQAVVLGALRHALRDEYHKQVCAFVDAIKDALDNGDDCPLELPKKARHELPRERDLSHGDRAALIAEARRVD